MAAGGARKAALLLMALDQHSAAELLRSARPETAAEIAAEMTCLNESGPADGSSAKTVREFVGLLNKGKPEMTVGKRAVQNLLTSAFGKDKSQQVFQQIQDVLYDRDPFLPVRSADVGEIAAALKGESAGVAAMVLSELPPARSAKLLTALEASVRVDAVRGLMRGTQVAPEARRKVATVVRARLQKREQGGEAAAAAASGPGQVRKVALLLRGLEKEFRDGLMESISAGDKETGSSIEKMMVTWEDVPAISDRCLQESLRVVDTRKLALALVKAEDAVVKKIRANISERASTMLDEEASLLSSPKSQDVEQSREAILDALRKLSAKGELTFVES